MKTLRLTFLATLLALVAMAVPAQAARFYAPPSVKLKPLNRTEGHVWKQQKLKKKNTLTSSRGGVIPKKAATAFSRPFGHSNRR